MKPDALMGKTALRSDWKERSTPESPDYAGVVFVGVVCYVPGMLYGILIIDEVFDWFEAGFL